MDKPDQAELDAARQAAFEDTPSSEIVEHASRGGKLVRYEVRPLSLADERACRQGASKPVVQNGKHLRGPDGQPLTRTDEFELGIRRVVAATYLPGTQERIFNRTDLEALLGQRVGHGSLMLKLSQALARVGNVREEDERGNSSGPADSTSSSSSS